MSYKYCFVPGCKNTTRSAFSKLFVTVPLDIATRKKWMNAVRRDEKIPLSPKSSFYCCEDHFNKERDFENYRYVALFKASNKNVRIKLRKNVLPSKFECQISRLLTEKHSRSSSVVEKLDRKKTVEKLLSETFDNEEDRIIDAVYLRRPIWDPNDPLRKQSSMMRLIWKDIEEELNTPAQIIKNKWKNLRAYYIDLLRKKQLAEESSSELSLSAQDEEIKWPRFQKMHFLNETLSPTCTSQPIFKLEYDDFETPTIQEPLMTLIKTEPDPLDTSNLQKKVDKSRKTKSDVKMENKIIKKPRPSERDQNTTTYTNDEDEDDLFFKSLLPSMRMLSPVQKLIVRSKIQNAILNSMISNET